MSRIDQTQAGLYQDGVGITNEFTFEPGICILPLAEDPPTSEGDLKTWSPVVVLRLHAPYRIRRQNFTAKKTNNPPVVPSPVDTGKFVFAGGSMSVATALNGTLANYDWLVTTEYVYVEDCVSRPQDGFVLGAPPYDTLIEATNSEQFGGAGGPFTQLPPPVPAPPTIGAISAAGPEAQTGWLMGEDVAESGGTIDDIYGYNCRSFFPGSFLSSNMVND